MNTPDSPFYAYSGPSDESSEGYFEREIHDWPIDDPCPECGSTMQFMVESEEVDHNDMPIYYGYVFCACGFQEYASY